MMWEFPSCNFRNAKLFLSNFSQRKILFMCWKCFFRKFASLSLSLPFIFLCYTSKNWCSWLKFNLCAYVTNFLHQFSPHERGYLRMCQKSILEYRIFHRDSMIGSSNERFQWWSRWVCLRIENKIAIRLNSKVSIKTYKNSCSLHSPYINLIGLDVSNRISYERHLFFTHARQRHTNPSQHGNRRQECLQKLRLHSVFLVPIQYWYAINFDVAYRRWLQCFRNGFECFRCIVEMNYPITNF